MAAVKRTLYRALLRQARVHQEHPAFKAFLTTDKITPREVKFLTLPTKEISVHHELRIEPGAPSLERECWTKFLSGESMYYIPDVDLLELVRSEFRRETADYPESERIRFAFEVLRILNDNSHRCKAHSLDRSPPKLEESAFTPLTRVLVSLQFQMTHLF
eukprot:TRINITY_DN7449_c0_g1_i1.p1 TRINITY_DN7449_c0_g1~~TRINITY_DN7449_c0_g1_i1.p1  ORF type:complete len:160 (-),score=26.40 TRINITY_DN7449_c0_g1_i1:314-793(-)